MEHIQPTTQGASVHLYDVVSRKALKAGAVGGPMLPAAGGDATIIVEVYALGRGVTLVRKEGDLPGRQGTLELKAAGHFLVFDPLACDHANWLVVTVQRYVRTISKALKTVKQESAPEFDPVSSDHGVSSLRTAILQLPQGMGKSTVANALAAWLGCSTVVDEWIPGNPVMPGALHLTSMEVAA